MRYKNDIINVAMFAKKLLLEFNGARECVHMHPEID